MDIFAVISIIAFAVVLAGCILHFIFRRPSFDDLFGPERNRKYLDCVRFLIFSLTLLLPLQKSIFLVKIRRLLLALAVICFLILVVTGFFPSLVLGESIFGYWTMIHITFGGVFAFCLAFLALLWAEDNKIDANSCSILRWLLSLEGGDLTPADRAKFLHRLLFWLLMILSIPLVLSVLLSMFTLFGTEIQEFLLAFHKYTAIAFALSAILFAYLSIINYSKRIAT